MQLDLLLPGLHTPGHTIFLALQDSPFGGSAVVPFGQHAEGSTVYLPFRATHLYAASLSAEGTRFTHRSHTGWSWSPIKELTSGFSVKFGPDRCTLDLDLAMFGSAKKLQLALWAKNSTDNDGWGSMVANPDGSTLGGLGDQSLRAYFHIDLQAGAVEFRRSRFGAERVRIYQLMPRLFSNTNETRKTNGTMLENGVGKFREINDAALTSLKDMGFTHLFLTGVLRQATSTEYPRLRADDPDILKGLAGSPYAVRDVCDVCPDYAVDPENRMAEFRELIARCHTHGLKVLIDMVPNHVARSHASVTKPELSFGVEDDRAKFFHPRNNFFWMRGELRLPTVSEDGRFLSPTCQVLGKGDGRYPEEKLYTRVSGNNVTNTYPSINDWYETAKLNYGYDFVSGIRQFPHAETPEIPVPDTWHKMDAVLAWWQSVGVDGFRCDMAHMVPPEFWAWAIGRARERNGDVFFLAEAYDSDPMKVSSGDPMLRSLNDGRGHVMTNLMAAGFDSVYDDPSYKVLKGMFDGGNWANDLDRAFSDAFLFDNGLRYVENHDEVRIAAKNQWGNIGPTVGRPVSAILYGISRGPVMVYSGQEVGVRAEGSEGFSDDNGRTSIFDYWSIPEMLPWINDHKYDGALLSEEAKNLREYYRTLLRLVGEPAFRTGFFFPLNPANIEQPGFGRLGPEGASGHWLYAYLRIESRTGQWYLIVANLNPKEAMTKLHIEMSSEALAYLGDLANVPLRLEEKLVTGDTLAWDGVNLKDGIDIEELPALSAYYILLRRTST